MGTIECAHCRNQFAGRIRNDGKQKKFCSWRCFQLHRGILRECKSCGKEFVTYCGGLYCSRACYEMRSAVQKLSYECLICGRLFHRDRGVDLRSDRDPERPRYCSRKCFFIASTGEQNPRYRGVRKAYRGKTWREQNQKLRSLFSVCKLCGATAEGRAKHVDHIVPFVVTRGSVVDSNGDPNLWVLCRRCHCRKTHLEYILLTVGVEAFIKSLTETWKGDEVRAAITKAFAYFGRLDSLVTNRIERSRMKVYLST